MNPMTDIQPEEIFPEWEGVEPKKRQPDEVRHVAVSVIIPIYNAVEFLPQALRGVLQQTLTDMEVICIDDGSTDGCLKTLREMQKTDNRIRILTESNAGPGRARNLGLSYAVGEYVIFLDADDIFEPTLLETLYKQAETQKLDITLGDYDLYRTLISRFTDKLSEERPEPWQAGEILSKSAAPETIFQMVDGYIWNKLFSRTFLLEKQLEFPGDIRVFEDSYFVATALSLAERVGRCDEVLLHHRLHHGQSRPRLYRKYYMQVPELLRRLYEFLKKRGMYLPLSVSYARLSADLCCKMYHMLWAEAQHAFWDCLHVQYETIGWDEKTPSHIVDADVADFVANVETYNFEQYSARLVKGNHLTEDVFLYRHQRAGRRRRFRAFFASLFGRKKR